MSVMVPRQSFRISSVSESTVDEFRMVPSKIGNRIYRVGQWMTRPFEREMDLATRLFHPTPGIVKEEHEKSWKDTAIRVLHALEVCTIIVPLVTGILALLGLALRAIVTAVARPDALLLRIDGYKPYMGDQIHLMTYNTALMPKYACNVNETRDPTVRAQEIVDAIMADVENMPDVICFQEVFDSRSAKILIEGLRSWYGDIVYNVAPTEFGLNSGLVIASKFEITSIDFKGFSNLQSEDWLANKGLLGVDLDLGYGHTAKVYNTHFQAKTGEKYETAREEQLEAVGAWVEDSAFCCGDFNFKKEMKQGLEGLENAFLMDHNVGSLDRRDGTRQPFPNDWTQPGMSESKGSWFSRDDEYGSWGSEYWDQERRVDSVEVKGPQAMPDMILTPQNLDGSTQVRNLGSSFIYRSGMSDHLPISLITTIPIITQDGEWED